MYMYMSNTIIRDMSLQLSYGIKYIISEFLANLRLFCHYISLLPMY